MGQKVNPNGFRYGITKLHKVNWFAEKGKFIEFLLEDQKIYEYIEKFTREYSIGKIEISRNQKNDVLVKIYSSKPGIILGENSKNLISFKKDIQKFTRNKKLNLNINVITIEKPELNARLVAENIAIKLENRGSFRAAQKQAIRFAFKNGAKGIKTSVSGRLNGVDMARTEGYTEGEMKLHTLRQDIDYAKTTAKTTYGALGIKVWISKGEKIEKSKK